MKSFPSTLNESQNMYGSSKSESYTNTFDIERLKAINLNKSVPVVQELLKEQNINASNYQRYPYMHSIQNPHEMITSNTRESETRFYGDDNIPGSIYGAQHNNQTESIFYENPLELPADIIALAKDYDWVYKYRVKSILRTKKEGDSLLADVADTAVSPSMFNPMFGVNVKGIIRNTPLINDTQDSELDPQITDCSIRTLCALSKNANSPLGQARYKYADFMYCKDLGKVSNNHLITLRKFAHPVGDHIFEMTTPQMVAPNPDISYQVEGDVGHLVAWFGTDDNRLEDICKYSYHATWKELNAQIEEQESKADDETSGFIGMVSNSLNPLYNESVGKGQAGQHSIWGWLGSKYTNGLALQGIGKNNGLLRNYDNNKVYTPKNTMQSTNIYEGKLEFSHEFTLVFSYQLRAYENINPRSAMLDLIGNVLEVTYRRGKFWGGSRKIIGPPQDLAPFNKTSAFIDNAFDKLGGYFQQLSEGTVNFKSTLGAIGQSMMQGIGQAWNSIKNMDVSEAAGELVESFKNAMDNTGWAEACKGMLKNALGRPTLFAWQSLLTGDDVGLWHVTIGNPRNPILSIGNLILTDASIRHSGPLGIDDFPTELKVTVTLKHARPRDVTDIGRMYTKGASAIYQHFGHHELKDFFGQGSQDNVNKEEYVKKNTTVTTDEKGDKSTDEMKQRYIADTLNYKDKTEISLVNYNGVNGILSNPFLTSEDAKHIMRTNNWSDTMFSVAMQEVA